MQRILLTASIACSIQVDPETGGPIVSHLSGLAQATSSQSFAMSDSLPEQQVPDEYEEAVGTHTPNADDATVTS
jgi:hypothetical protein